MLHPRLLQMPRLIIPFKVRGRLPAPRHSHQISRAENQTEDDANSRETIAIWNFLQVPNAVKVMVKRSLEQKAVQLITLPWNTRLHPSTPYPAEQTEVPFI